MRTSGKVNSLVYWAEDFRHYPIVAEVARKCVCIAGSWTSYEKTFRKSGHIVKGICTGLSDEQLKELSLLSRNRNCCSLADIGINTIQAVQSDLMLSCFLELTKFCYVLWLLMLSADGIKCAVPMPNIAVRKCGVQQKLYLNAQRSLEIVHTRQELHLNIMNNTKA